jgi:hypothetical protein
MTANRKAKFCMGQAVVATPGAIEAMEASGQHPYSLEAQARTSPPLSTST